MRIELDGYQEVRVAAGPDHVVDTLADARELRDMLDGMLRPSSTAERWIMLEMRVGPVVINPAIDVTVAREQPGRVALEGRPVPGHTRATLDLAVIVRTVPRGGDGAVVSSRWGLEVDVPGPQLLASSVRPLMAASSRATSRQLADRLRRRFAPAP